MKKLLAAAAAVSMLAVSAPAFAQYRDRDYDRHDRDYDRYDRNINAEQRQIAQRIYVGSRSGRLSNQERDMLRADLDHIARLEARYRRNGLSGWERADLSRRLDRLESMVVAESRDRNNRRG